MPILTHHLTNINRNTSHPTQLWRALQVALEAERAKRKVGRTFLGDLEKSTLGKGKMQAAGLYSKHLTTGGLVGSWLPAGWVGEWDCQNSRGRWGVVRGLITALRYLGACFRCRRQTWPAASDGPGPSRHRAAKRAGCGPVQLITLCR